jgi:ribulose-phosphate 3-epimerase
MRSNVRGDNFSTSERSGGESREIRIAPSILSADFARLADEIARVEAAGADWIHVDVMDGHFVPNLTIGPPVVRAIRKVAKRPLDVHIMIEAPERWAEEYVKAGADILTFHVEATKDAAALCERIRALGARAGVAFRPRTPLVGFERAIDAADLVLVMTVEPGFGGQKFMADQVGKVAAAAERAAGRAEIEVDGGIDDETVAPCVRAGANAIVAGSYVFRATDLAVPIRALRDRAAKERAEAARALKHSLDET